mmetsp:Transcript_14486/g.25962  ORF Transcript_14486/g.25962 Transcript_14486/m.25962 type:complete len:187 (-) Transcript_14486:416-976(-)|eukprot:CAMPEP_0184535444 /NCGR_PEP_ID=MMETSP0198_2-20121128/15898_1 /TAXON_ID=1112570 /ORGANISM="Thraustochytrium sp., Strain LLF1b" /LENGTH=186 /DNA_ID=CAMNT_0026928497 /DNA_START=87 /DNA_END=647 /DNA_ORIENTATION=-
MHIPSLYALSVVATLLSCAAGQQDLDGLLSEPQECPGETTWKSCGTACPKVCSQPGSGSGMCIQMCVSECQCPKNKWLHESTNKCLDSFEDCALLESEILPNPTRLEPRMMKDPQNNIARPVSDTPSCPGDLVWRSCGTACPFQCENPESASGMCNRMCVPECQCPPNMWRDGTSDRCFESLEACP